MRTAPSAALAITGELEKVAKERQGLEHTLERRRASKGDAGGTPVTKDSIKSFAAAVRERLAIIDVGLRQQLLSILGFEATATRNGEVQASILVPAEVNPNHHCTNMGMTTWM